MGHASGLPAKGAIVFGTRKIEPRRTSIGARVPDPPAVEDIVRGFYDRFPSLRDVRMQRTWGGWIAMTPSWLPVAGKAGPNVIYAVGLTATGWPRLRTWARSSPTTSPVKSSMTTCEPCGEDDLGLRRRRS